MKLKLPSFKKPSPPAKSSTANAAEPKNPSNLQGANAPHPADAGPKATAKPKAPANNLAANAAKSAKPISNLQGANAPQDQFTQGITSVKDIIAPGALEIDFNYQKIANTYFRTLFVSGYPRFVNANWLSPLINFEHSLNLAMYIYPVEGRGIMDDLRRKVGEMEAEIQSDTERGRIADVSTKVKLEDAKKLQLQLAKGSERFFQFGLYVTISSKSLEELNKITQQVQSTLGSLLIIAKTSSLQMEQAFKTTLPTAQDRLMITRNMDTTSLATTFPFTSSELTQNQGILYGINEHNGSLVILDRFSMENANSVVFAKSGAGKSIAAHEPVLVDDGSGPKLKPIGPLIDQLIKKHGSQPIDHELEGVINPNLKVLTFNSSLKNQWAQVTVAARKKSPKKLYQFTTASGRKITTTADHNLVILDNGKVVTKKSADIKPDDFIPIPRKIQNTAKTHSSINLLTLLKNSKHVYVFNASNLIKKHYSLLKSHPIVPLYDKYLYKYKVNRPIPLKYFNKILKKINLQTHHPSLNALRLGSRIYHPKTSLPINLSFTPSLAKLIGYYLAEGGSTSNYIHITQLNPLIKKDIQSCIKKLKLAHFTTPQSIRIGSRVVVELFRSLKLGDNAGSKSTPSIIYQQPLKSIQKLLSAYFEGDGTIDGHSVSAVSKSSKLISEISYLLLYFGIICRIKKVLKRATNTQSQKRTYYQLAISGQLNLKKFAKKIGFVSFKKTQGLKAIVGLTTNTNVDIIPQTQSLLCEIYQVLYSSPSTKSPNNLSPTKRGIFNPSRQTLNRLIKRFEQKIAQIEHLPKNGFKAIDQLTELQILTNKIKNSKRLNSLAWQQLGQSWQLIKNQQVSPGANNIFKLLKTVEGYEYPISIVKKEIYHSFKVLGHSLKDFDSSLWTTITQRPLGDTSYQRLIQAKKHLSSSLNEKLLQLKKVKLKINQLKKLARSGLFWDPIVSIKAINKHRQKYVYDLTVDNEVFVAGYAGMFVHNSYLVKLEALRSLMFDSEVIIIDPENEYQPLCEAVGGQYIDFSFESNSKINPFDLSQVYEEGQNELGQKVLSLHSLFKIIMGSLSPQEEALLDRAIILTYKQKGITPDPATQKKEPPLIEDLYKVLIGMEEAPAESLAARLEKYVKGSFRGIFDQHTNIDIKNTFTVFSVKRLEDALRPIAMFMILDFIWTRIKKDLKKRLLIIDEAWYMMKYPDSASFIYSMAKRARKYYLGLTTITQDVEDFLGSDYGKAIVTNSSVQILMKQSPAAIDNLAKTFYLSEGEKHLLLAAGIGHGIIFAGSNHVALSVVASPEEHSLITSDPKELLAKKTPPKPPASGSSPAPPPQPIIKSSTANAVDQKNPDKPQGANTGHRLTAAHSSMANTPQPANAGLTPPAPSPA